jgi:hypothetical protein
VRRLKKLILPYSLRSKAQFDRRYSISGRLAEVAKRFLDQAALAAQIKALSNVANVDSNGMPGDIESIRRGTVIIPAADRISGQQSQEGTGPSSHSVEFTYDSRLKFLHDTVSRHKRLSHNLRTSVTICFTYLLLNSDKPMDPRYRSRLVL